LHFWRQANFAEIFDTIIKMHHSALGFSEDAS
jgi:hypothetical protein